MTGQQELVDPLASSTYFSDEGLREKTRPWLNVSGSLAVAGTSSTQPDRAWEGLYVPHATTASASLLLDEYCTKAEAPAQAIIELRRISGLTWDQLGQLFEVSRRSIHFWASGKPLNAANEARLMRVLAIIRYADRGDAGLTRRALFEPVHGRTPFDLLVEQRFEEARRLLGEGVHRDVQRIDLSAAAKRGRRPLTPAELVDATHDPAHRDQERSRPARTIRNGRSTRG